LPLVARAGLALGSAGPSITMAACCEVLAFGLGALTSMPAVRNFSICAAIAVGLDFLLQVSAMWSCMEEGGAAVCVCSCLRSHQLCWISCYRCVQLRQCCSLKVCSMNVGHFIVVHWNNGGGGWAAVCNYSSGQCGRRTLLVSDVRRSCVIAGRKFECHLDHASHPSVRLPSRFQPARC
jgi:hypothetical protein